MLDRLEFLISEAFVSLRRNSWMTFAAVTTSAMALFLIGGIGLIYIALSNFAGSIESKFEMRVHMKDAPSQDEIDTLGARIKTLDGVAEVTFKNRNEVWEEFRNEHPDMVADMGEDIENPMPDTYTVTFENLNKADTIAKTIQTMPEVSQNGGVKYLAEVQNLLEKAMRTLRWLGVLLGGLMLTTGGILIYNTIRLTMIARRKEIRIMELVGATKNMVLTPLLIEGATQGLLGALFASGVLAVAYSITAQFVSRFSTLATTEPFPAKWTIIVLGAIGLVYGLVCSVIAIREPKQKEIPR